MNIRSRQNLEALVFFIVLMGWITIPVIGYASWKSKEAAVVRSPNMDRIYYTKFGGVYCGSMTKTDCGIKLEQCADDRVYECLHDVAWADSK